MNDLSILKELFPDLIEKSIPDDSYCNFYFVKKYNLELYENLMLMEGMVKTDLKNCAKNIRDVLTMFMQEAFKNDSEALNYAKESSEHELSLNGYLKAASNFSRLHINAALGYKAKAVTNKANHIEDLGDDVVLDYEKVTSAIAALHELLKEYYSSKHLDDAKEINSKKYNKDYQPINDMIVYDTEKVESGSCEAQYLCYKKVNNSYLYYVIRQYPAFIKTAFSQREEEVLNKLWNESIRTPQGVVKYERIESKDGKNSDKDKKIFICYQMNGRPMRINPTLMESWTFQNKMGVILLLAEGIANLHKRNIYHRNLQPTAVYAYRVGEDVGINLVNFEFAKVVGSDVTVFSSAVNNFYEDFIFTAPELKHITKPSDYEDVNWEKADIYSLGVLFAYILLGGNFDIKGSRIKNIQIILNKLSLECPMEFKELLLAMCSNVASIRPKATEVVEKIEKLIMDK